MDDDGNIPAPPEEPFPYMTDHSYFGVNSPIFLTFYGLSVVGAGVWILVWSLRQLTEGVQGIDLYIAFLSFVFLGLGVHAVRMGIARMKWKREYERVMGRSPFQ